MTNAHNPVRRFVARTAREAMAQVRNTFGEDAVILANRPANGGVEILAIGPADMDAIAQTAAMPVPALAAPAPTPRAAARPAANAVPSAANAVVPNTATRPAARLHQEPEPSFASRRQPSPRPTTGNSDADKLEMSTLAFQDYVRRRMQERQAQEHAEAPVELPAAAPVQAPRVAAAAAAPVARAPSPKPAAPVAPSAPARTAPRVSTAQAMPSAAPDTQVLAELQAMKGLIEDQLGTMAWLDQVRRDPAQARALRKMLSAGFSPSLSRSITARLPAALNESEAEQWLLEVLVRNLRVDDATTGMVEQGGVYALVGPTGVGKTTTTAKLAATAALMYGPGQVGLITLDSYRLGAHDQLRAYGKILGIAVHIAHDAQALADLLQLLSNKKLVLIDTVGMSQRDARVREQRAMLDLPGIERVIVLNAAAQSEAIEDTVRVWRPERAAKGAAAKPVRAIVTKLDEAVTTGGVLDVAVRHELVLSGVGNGQRVPEDWHAPNPRLLMHQALRRANAPAHGFAYSDEEVALAFAVRREALRRQDGELPHA
ncbi:MAG TPA: flagellar biosynthesis protein FlhF [Burkholderiaceae bacterium]|nr:flagellar biosynthesis protein FlhF [Burkholderiaceae bacterium]